MLTVMIARARRWPGPAAAVLLALALVLAVAVGLYVAGLAGRTDPAAARAGVSEARALAEEHAATMAGSSERLATAVSGATGDHREHWDADAASMRADADRLRELAVTLRWLGR